MKRGKFTPLSPEDFNALSGDEKEQYRIQYSAHEDSKSARLFWSCGAGLTAALLYWKDSPEIFGALIVLAVLWGVWAFNRY